MSTTNEAVVIVGGGQAAATCAVELRKQGYAGRVMIIGDEPILPYKRPPLSKAYLAGTAKLESLYVTQPAFLEKSSIECRTQTRVVGIDRSAAQLQLSDGHTLAYRQLVLATGGRARPLPVPGADLPGVHLLRSVADVDAIRAQCHPGRHVVIVGGGFIGLEVAAVAVKLGLKVTVLEGLPRVLARVTAPQMSEFFEAEHRKAGVDLRTGAQVRSLAESATGITVQLGDDSRIEADFVVVGIGLIPNTELAAGAGLATDDGISVNEFCRTADPNIYAVGDCSNHPSLFYQRRVRLESVNNAMEQGRAAARAIVGQAEPYDAVPWFWSDQYDLKLQMVGLSEGYDACVLRGDPADRSFSLLYLRDGTLIAADSVSRPKDFMVAKKLVAARVEASPEQWADLNMELNALLPAA